MDAATVSGAIVYVLTEIASTIANSLKVSLPPFVKQVLALLIATGFNFGGLIPAVHLNNDPQLNAALSSLLAWFVSMVAHDVAKQVQPSK